MPKQESRNNVVPLRKQNPLVTKASFAIVLEKNDAKKERLVQNFVQNYFFLYFIVLQIVSPFYLVIS